MASRTLVPYVTVAAFAIAGLLAQVTSAQPLGHPDAEPAHAFHAANPQDAAAWQSVARELLFRLLKIDDLRNKYRPDPAGPSTLPTNIVHAYPDMETEYYRYSDILFRVEADRNGVAVVTIPHGTGPFPAVVCIPGHFAGRDAVHSRATPYRGFATLLAESGYITLATETGHHETYNPSLTLVGERIWTLMRAVDALMAMPEVDPSRIGVAGLSLGGELAIWLSAMDIRVQSAVVAGWLGSTADLRARSHCPCWEFDGFATNFDFVDAFTLIAPRPLLVQQGAIDPQFPLGSGQAAFARVRANYTAFGHGERVQLAVHPGGHELDPKLARAFFDETLGGKGGAVAKTSPPPSNSGEDPPFWLVTLLGVATILSLSYALLLRRRLRNTMQR